MGTLPPLKGVKVLELAGLAPSPFAGLILADYGADVVRVDRLVTPFGPPRDSLVRRKRSVVIDLKTESSRSVFLELVKSADVLLDPYRPGVMFRLGIGPETVCSLNPRLIYAQIQGFRADGMYGQRAGHDINYLAVSGVLSLLGRKGEKPAPPGNILGDFAGGGHACVTGILLALLHRQSSGRGQVVETNMVDGSTYLATFPRQHWGHQNWDRPRGENLLDGAAPFYEVYETEDSRFVAVGAQEPQFYRNLLTALGLESMPEQWDRQHWPATKAKFSEVFRTKTMQDWRAVFDHIDACVSPVLNMDEIEMPFRPLTMLSRSPSLDVANQDLWPELQKGQGSEKVLQEWVPQMCSRIETDPSTKLLMLSMPAKL